jgi:hypothetical protein
LESATTGNDNTASGLLALTANTTGSSNTATGAQALQSNTTGEENTAAGSAALSNNTTGNYNTATGTDALFYTTTGSNNTATGMEALMDTTTGASNTALGMSALVHNSTGNDNTGSGADVLVANTTGSFNTADGMDALNHDTTGGNNLALGFAAGTTLVSGNNNIYLLSDAATSSESNTIRIGSAQKAAFLAGVSGVTVTGVPVLVSSTGQLGVQTSSARYKQDIEPMAQRSASLMQLHPVTFHYRADPHGALQYGLIAEQVGEVYPDLVVKGDDGKIEAIRYQELTPMLLNEVQKQARALRRKDAEIAALATRLSAIEEHTRSGVSADVPTAPTGR